MLSGKTYSNLISYCTALLILLWAYTTVSKVTDLKAFELQLKQQIFDAQYANLLMWLVLLAESLTLVLLLFKHSNKVGCWLSAVLMLAFTLYIALGLLGFYPKMPCSCGGVISNLSWQDHFWFNCFFLLLSILAIYCHKKLKPVPK